MKLLQHEPSPVCGKSSVKKGLRAYAAAAPFVLPGLLLVLAFVIYPMFFTIRIALSEYRIVQGEITFIGLENFKNVLSGGSRFWYAYRNNFLYALVTVPFILLGGMLFAYLINNLRRGQTIFRVGFYLPVITSWVIVSLVFQYMFNNSDRGLINYLLVDVLHVMDDYVPWLLREWSGNAAIWLMGIWKNVGWGTIIYFAALTGIGPELYEAGMVDGANRWQRMRYITLPGILPAVSINLIFSVSGIVYGGFDQIYNLYNPLVYDKADILETYLFRNGVIGGDYSLGTAMGLFNSVVAFILVILANKVIKKLGGDGIW